jgi:hypothetical protein
MRSNLAAYKPYQVFLNYPFDAGFEPLANAMHFAVVAAGLLPVCAKDLTAPDRPRLDMIIDAITNCHYSAHDFSKVGGEGTNTLAHFNMPLEMGMALFHAYQTQRQEHRCAFFISTPHLYQAFVSDLAGLDPILHRNDDLLLASGVYEWLRNVVPPAIFNLQPSIEVTRRQNEFKARLSRLRGNGKDGLPSHAEVQELIYQICEEAGWWDWRAHKAGRMEFPPLPLSWSDQSV